MHKSLPFEDYKEINRILNSETLKVENYIDSFIEGSVIVNERFLIDDNFNKCQQKFCDIQLLIKKKLEEIDEKSK